jgi:hypothetical protein
MAKKKTDDPLSVGHHSGERIYGYDVLGDGSVRLCRSVTDQLDGIVDSANGLRALQDNVSLFVAKQMAEIEKTKRKCWEDIFADLKIPKGQLWQYDPYKKTVYHNKDEQPPEPPEA